VTALTIAPELSLPWESSREEDRLFKKVLHSGLATFLVLAIVLPYLPVSEPEQPRQQPVVEHLARIVLEKKALPQPPAPVPKPPVPQKKTVEKPEPVKKLKERPARPVDQAAVARKVAREAGVLAFQDDLQEMRDSLDLDSLNRAHSSRGQATAATLERALITAPGRADSGGIKTAALSRDSGGAALSALESSRVESTIASAVGNVSNSQSVKLGGRSDESIRREMDRNKGAIFAIYNRALREDPLLEGKLVFEMLIDPSGAIGEIVLLESELGDDALTRKILSRIRMIRFSQENVITTRVNYSFDFLPYT
jgi:periplasmic protein TonB